MGRALWVCAGILVVTFALASCGWAVERELVGVRLGDRALALLDKPGYGQPDYIGPLGAISVASAEAGVRGQTGTRAAGRSTRAGMQTGPSGPSAGTRGAASRRGMSGGMGGAMGGRGGMGGRRGMMGASAPGASQLTAQQQPTVLLTGMPGSRSGPGGMAGQDRMGGGMGGGRMGMGGGGGMRGGGMRGGGASTRGRAGTATAGRTRATTGGAGVQGPGMYWYYRRPGGAVAVLSLDLEGRVTQITLSGSAPTPGGRTSKGIGLGNSYMDIISRYGYPDQTVSSGSVITMGFVDHGVRFILDAMRVREIAIGAGVAAEAEIPEPGTGEIEQPPTGMSIEELRGYL